MSGSFIPVADDVWLLEVPHPGVWTGVTLVRSAECNVLVDSGGSAETVDQAIVPALEELGLALGDIDWVVATHIHGDHVGGIARMRALAPEIGVAVFRASDGRMRDPLAYSREIRAKFPDHSAAPPAVLDGVAPDRLLDDGDVIGPVRLVHTPGHDTDACCFLDERSGTLITGDSLQFRGTAVQGCALLFDPASYRASMERLAAYRPARIVCGHPFLPFGAVAHDTDEAAVFLAACIASYEHDAAFVESMTRAGVNDPLRVAGALVASVGGKAPEHMFLPMHTVSAIQAALRKEVT